VGEGAVELAIRAALRMEAGNPCFVGKYWIKWLALAPKKLGDSTNN